MKVFLRFKIIYFIDIRFRVGIFISYFQDVEDSSIEDDDREQNWNNDKVSLRIGLDKAIIELHGRKVLNLEQCNYNKRNE